ncbi:hypothetical protein M378DRAFT_185130 [Amanita muscaria Koide BX008]|uniref:Tr-type G domain-containing protein n=1 Tax=Amanita muscaria (strain Koide BX008) TaxID=946122 RepID=A0A0C2XF75_AMAMK|nr:hypothetical protein M378DRAFT_185130 [Amanita muscaria Koide BX008]
MRLPRRTLGKLSEWRLVRQYSTNRIYDPALVRNLALVAHIDSGKTTLTESILLKSSYLSVAGSVDTGSTTTDFLPEERERGITIQSASIPINWRAWTLNLIDTPGHADFGMEVESASRIVDGAVVLMDAVEGVESQTMGVWRQLDRYGVTSRIIFVNKLDRPGASFHSSVSSILLHRLHSHPMVLTLPISSFIPAHYTSAEPGLQGLVDLVDWRLWKWEGDAPTSYALPDTPQGLQHMSCIPKDHPILPHIFPARTQLLENLSMFSDDLLDALLNGAESEAYLNIPSPMVKRSLRQATLNNSIVPVICGSAIKHIGTDLVLDYAGELLASPVDVPHEPQNQKAPLKMLAWKVMWDSRRGWMTFVRVYSGKLTRQNTILNTKRNQREKVSKILLLYASNAVEVDELPFGAVGVVLGLKYTRTGDTLVSFDAGGHQSLMRDITSPPAVISTSVLPHSHSDLEPLQEALHALVRTDPSIRFETQEGQLIVHGLGSLHLEIIEGRLKNEWKTRFEFGKRRVSYREGFRAQSSQALDDWQVDVGGKRVTIGVELDVSSLEHADGDPTWDGNLVIDANGISLPSPESATGTPESHIAQGISSVLSNSPHTSLAMTRMRIQVRGYTLPPSVPPSFLGGAAVAILRDHIKASGPGPLYEPYVLLKINVNEGSLGKVMKNLIEYGGEVQDLDIGAEQNQSEILQEVTRGNVYLPHPWLSPSHTNLPGKTRALEIKRSIQALAPLSQFLDYSGRLRALSGGLGTFEMLNAGFREVTPDRQPEILKEIGRA